MKLSPLTRKRKRKQQPAARRANIDFERSERERIHFETATRVMNYEIQAQRSEAAAAAEVDEELSPEEARKLRRAALRDDFYGLIEVTVSLLFGCRFFATVAEHFVLR